MSALAVHVGSASIEPSGLRVLRMSVADESDDDPAGGAAYAAMFEQWEADLRAMRRPARPEIRSGGIVIGSLNGVAARIYHSPALAHWARRLVSGGALANVFLPHQRRLLALGDDGSLFAGQELDEFERGFFLHAIDARGARARARIQQWLAARTLLDVNRPQAWTSVGCGAALPMVGAVADAAESGASVTAGFFDGCGDARELARRALAAAGVDPSRHRVLNWRIASREGLDGVVGPESQDLVDLVAVTDLLADGRAVELLRRGYAAVRPGGVLMFSVSLPDRPLPLMLEYGIGFAGSHPRSLEKAAAMLESAGIDVRDAMACLTPEGLHAVIEVRKL
ncbi:hypothetical protein [Demequina lignilytica]|uniref:Uncharacterized protein n=1 Tax=Demequina lignilytica TaxID=3051663 RepID=A0AB35MFB3_9MICO|nr:hypothetical protein [Demequina sp. SYSU T0a273]MDN4482450.1 hypothetical protein [Demequina sp. SYSU T0a273]